jgi:hypothetical protein
MQVSIRYAYRMLKASSNLPVCGSIGMTLNRPSYKCNPIARQSGSIVATWPDSWIVVDDRCLSIDIDMTQQCCHLQCHTSRTTDAILQITIGFGDDGLFGSVVRKNAELVALGQNKDPVLIRRLHDHTLSRSEQSQCHHGLLTSDAAVAVHRIPLDGTVEGPRCGHRFQYQEAVVNRSVSEHESQGVFLCYTCQATKRSVTIIAYQHYAQSMSVVLYCSKHTPRSG